MKSRIALVLVLAVALSVVALVPPARSADSDWTRVAERGIDDPNVYMMFPWRTFDGEMYFFVPETGSGVTVPIWAFDGTEFRKAAPDGFGDPGNESLTPGVPYKGNFYIGTGQSAGTGQLWRSPDGYQWWRVGETFFTDPDDRACTPLGVQDDRLLVAMSSGDGAKVWAYDGANFTRVNTDGFGLGAESVSLASTYGGRIHLTANLETGPLIPLAYNGGANWAQTAPPGFGDPNNVFCYVTTADDTGVYAGTVNPDGGQIWKFDGAGWNRIDTGQATSPQNTMLIPSIVAGRLYACATSITGGPPTGAGFVYRQEVDGAFEPWITDGFGDPGNNLIVLGQIDSIMVAGTYNEDGFQVWTMTLGPSISSITPNRGPYGTRVAIQGSGFEYAGGVGAAALTDSFVDFGGAKVYRGDTLSWTDTKIELRAPEGISDPFVSVVTDAGESNTVTFDRTASDTFYFAEGTTRENPADGLYQEWISIENPDFFNAASVDATYMFGGGEPTLLKTYQVMPDSRLTIDVALEVGTGHDVSVKIEGDRPVVAERSIYFDYRWEWAGGDSVTGVPSPSELWHFAEGTTRDNAADGTFETYLCLLNPGDRASNVEIQYMMSDGTVRDYQTTVPPCTRVTRDVALDVGADRDVSIKVEADLPVVAERPTYFDFHDEAPGGDCVMGAMYPSTEAYFAEGCTYDWASEYICIQNPYPVPASVDVTYMIGPFGAKSVKTIGVPPTSRMTIDVGGEVEPQKDVAVSLESDVPVVAERAMYFDYDEKWPGGHVAKAAPAGQETTLLADGTTRNNSIDGYFDQWLCLQNPSGEEAKVEVWFQRSDDTVLIRELALAPCSRWTLDVNAIVGEGFDNSTTVFSDIAILVERPTYFDYRGFADGGSVDSGYGL